MKTLVNFWERKLFTSLLEKILFLQKLGKPILPDMPDPLGTQCCAQEAAASRPRTLKTEGGGWGAGVRKEGNSRRRGWGTPVSPPRDNGVGGGCIEPIVISEIKQKFCLVGEGEGQAASPRSDRRKRQEGLMVVGGKVKMGDCRGRSTELQITPRRPPRWRQHQRADTAHKHLSTSHRLHDARLEKASPTTQRNGWGATGCPACDTWLTVAATRRRVVHINRSSDNYASLNYMDLTLSRRYTSKFFFVLSKLDFPFLLYFTCSLFFCIYHCIISPLIIFHKTFFIFFQS